MSAPVGVTLRTNGTPTVEEARQMPTFWRVARVNRSSHTCEACREHAKEPWVDGSACDEHTVEEVQAALTQSKSRRTYTASLPHQDAYLALAVLRAGGNPEPQYTEGTLGHAQWTYKRKGKVAERNALVLALTTTTSAALAA